MKNNLKHSLQIRFVLLSLSALVILQILIVGFSVARSYSQITKKADKIISMVLNDQSSEKSIDARYFQVVYSFNGKKLDIDLSHTELVKMGKATDYAKRVIVQKKEKGYIDDYRYFVQRDKREIHIVFLAISMAMQSFRTNAESLIMLSIIGLGVMAILLSLISGKVIEPIVYNRQKQKEFIASASHELKTPLTVILADSQILEEEIGENEWLLDIMKQSKHLSEMTNRLIYLSRLEEQESRLVKIDFPISDVAEDIVQSFSAIAKNSHKEFDIQIQQGITFHGDEESIRELMAVLLDNAFKYSTENGRVNVKLFVEKHYIVFQVENTVSNIDDISISRFTERFYRGNTSYKAKGFGIGLAVAQTVAEAHEGKLIIKKLKNDRICFRAMLK